MLSVEMFQNLLFKGGTKTIQILVFSLLSLKSRFKKHGFVLFTCHAFAFSFPKWDVSLLYYSITQLGILVPYLKSVRYLLSNPNYCEDSRVLRKFSHHYDAVSNIGERPQGFVDSRRRVFTVIWHLIFRLYPANPVYTCPLAPGTMVARRPTDQIDSAPFVVGMITVLKQFHSEYTEQFLACCGQYVRSLIEASATK